MPVQPRPDPERPRALPLVAAVVGVGVIAVVAAGTSASWNITDRFRLFDTQPSYTPPSVPAPSAAPQPKITPGPDLSGWLTPLLWVLLVLAVIVAVSVLWRMLPRRPAKKRRSALGDGVLGQPIEEAAPAVQAGLGAAQHLLDTVTDPTDAVLAAWVALEQAAGRSGHPRRPADTPTEFTVEVLSVTPADRTAVAVLLGLYHRARFSDTGVGSDAVAEARRCLDALVRSWSAFSAAAAGTHPGSDPGAAS